MSKADKTDVFQLVKRLEKAEKRHFKLFNSKNSKTFAPLYVRLFDLMDKAKVYDENIIRSKLEGISPSKLINLKRHLYGAILKSLRHIHDKKNTDIWLREQIDYAKILYGKGLYFQSLRLLDKIKETAKKTNESFLIAEILEFQKTIETRHITRSRKVKNKVEALIRDSSGMSNIIENTVNLSNLALKIQGYYIRHGLVINEKEEVMVRDYFNANLPQVDLQKLGFLERAHYYQSHMWLEYIVIDQRGVYKYALYWVRLFLDQPPMQLRDPDLFMRGIHYLMTSSFFLRDVKRFRHFYQLLTKFYKTNEGEFNTTTKMLYFIYGSNSLFNLNLLTGEYRKALAQIPKIEQDLLSFDKQIDQHRSIIIYYKVAWLYFGIGQHLKALDYLNNIIHERTKYLKDDLKTYARILHLVIHVELGHTDLAEYLISSVERTMTNLDQKSKITVLAFEHLRHMISAPKEFKNTTKWENLHIAILKASKDKFEHRSLVYFNYVNWSGARAVNTSIAKFVRNEYLRTKNT